ncbi:hypothetical protein GCM10027443_00630 [Pontibacter brevis]
MQAQHLLGYAGSNYGGTNSVFLNPSSIAYSRQGFFLNLVGGHVTFANTYFYYDGAGVQLSEILEDPEYVLEGNGLFERSRIQERLNGKNKMAHFGAEARLPSFMLKLSPRHSIALTNRFRGVLQGTNVSEDLARVIGFGTNNPALQNTPFSGSEAYFNANAFAETGFTYSRVLLSQKNRFLKGGVTVKKLSGVYSAHLLAPQVDYQLKQNQEEEYYMQVQQGSARFGFSENEPEMNLSKAFLGSDNPGSGWGMDIGFTYEHRPDYADYQYTLDGEERTDHGENKYKYRLGVALLDIGSINYKNAEQVRAYNITRQNLDLTGDTFEDVDFENLGPTLEEALEVQPNERQTQISSGLPTTLHLNFDYQVTRNLFVNTAVLHNLRSKDAIAMHQTSALAISPRLEGKKLELAMPVYLTNNYQDLNFGAMLRLGSLVVGSNNLAAMLPGSKSVGPDLYMSLGISIGTGGRRAKIEEKARKKARKEQRKAEKAGTVSPVPAAPGTQNSTPVHSPANVPADTVNMTPAGAQITIPANSPSTTAAGSLTNAAIEPAKVVAADSGSSTTVKALEEVTPPTNAPAAAITVQSTPAKKAESGTAAQPEENKEAIPATKPAGAPAKASND